MVVSISCNIIGGLKLVIGAREKTEGLTLILEGEIEAERLWKLQLLGIVKQDQVYGFARTIGSLECRSIV